jgi:cytochrome c biogenesis protein CcdA
MLQSAGDSIDHIILLLSMLCILDIVYYTRRGTEFMVVVVLAFLGGILTIISPCILPVLPFVFARADQPFRKSGLPLLTGMALTFAGLAAVATAGGGWVVRANQYGRAASLVVLAVFGLMLLWPALADRLSLPLVRLGSRLANSSNSDSNPWHVPIFLARYCYRTALGSVCRADPRPDPDRSCIGRNGHSHRLSAARLRGWGSYIIGRGGVGGWEGVRCP